MPKLRPPGGRLAAAAASETRDEIDLESQNDQVLELHDEEGTQDAPLSRQNGEGAEDDPKSLKAQIAALKRSNQEYLAKVEAEQQEKAEAIRRAQDSQNEIVRLQEQTTSSQADAINAAMAAAEAEAESAQRDIEAAASLGDTRAQAEAYRKLSRAEAKLLRLEDGKEAMEREKTRKVDAPVTEARSADPLERVNLPPLAKNWLRKHPEFMHDPRKNSQIQVLHYDVVDEGLAPYSPEYFEVLEQKLGMRVVRRQEADDDEDDMEQPTRRTIVSAPPSRDVPSSNGSRDNDRVRLSVAEKEAARISGISEKEYAENKLKLIKEKAAGNYGGQP